MKAVIQTQYRENYGFADGNVGENAHWKCKGGNTYVVDITIEQNMSPEFWQLIQDAITYSNDASEEYIIGETVIDDIDYVESDHVEEWESVINLTLVDGVVHATQSQKSDHCWREGLLGSTETYTLSKGAKRDNYKVVYHMEDGRNLTRNYYQEWVAEQNAKAA